MSSFENDIPMGVSDEAERLICRHLDGEISMAGQARLDQILAGSAAARALLAEYRSNDSRVVGAMKSDLNAVGSANREQLCTAGMANIIPFRQRLRPIMVAAAGAVLTAAAVVLLSVTFNSNSAAPQVASHSLTPQVDRAPRVIQPSFVEYRNADHGASQRFGSGYRDLIGIRGSNPNRIYIFERGTQSTRSVPVSRDF